MYPKARREGLIVEEVGDALVIYDRARDEVHSLNPTAALIWRACDGSTSVARLAVKVTKQHGQELGTDICHQTIATLYATQLLEPSADALAPREEPMTRRDILAAGARAAPITLSLPIVHTLSAPPPVAASSAVACTTAAGADCSGAYRCRAICDCDGTTIVFDSCESSDLTGLVLQDSGIICVSRCSGNRASIVCNDCT